jgi:hypothetical protein
MNLTVGQFILAVFMAQIPLAALVVAVLRAVRKDSIETGMTRADIGAFSTKLVEMEKARNEAAATNDKKISDAVLLNDKRIAQAVSLNDQRIADILRISGEYAATREKEIIDTVRGFQATVEDLKVAVANVNNMWQADRKLIERVRDLELELAGLRAQHMQNHPTESQRNVLHREEGAPRVLGSNDDDSERSPR